MKRPLRRVAAALFVVSAGLFVVGVNAEDDTHDETTEAAEHNQANEASGHDETDEPAEAATDGGHDESAEAAEADVQTATAGEEDGEDERVLGIDVEFPAAVGAAVVSVALAVGLWLRKRRWLALLAVGFGIGFAVFDIAEINHQLDESRTGLALLAGTIALTHVAAAATAGLSARPTGSP